MSKNRSFLKNSIADLSECNTPTTILSNNNASIGSDNSSCSSSNTPEPTSIKVIIANQEKELDKASEEKVVSDTLELFNTKEETLDIVKLKQQAETLENHIIQMSSTLSIIRKILEYVNRVDKVKERAM